MVREIKKLARENRFLGPYYERAKRYKRERPLCGRHTFENRAKGRRQVCIVLAGYKEYLYPEVFGRIARYVPEDLDVCVCSSGLYSQTLARLCVENHWSYLSTERNNISLIENIAIRLHPEAEFIHKLDEDMFIAEDYFGRMRHAYKHACEGRYFPGVLAPLIPLNGYGHMRILEKLGLVARYEEMFGASWYAAGTERKIESDPSVARFWWGEGGYVPSIDEMNARFAAGSMEERPCPIRFSIGAILFRREIWENMGYFPSLGKGIGLGVDEKCLCAYCCTSSQPLMVSENVVVGHFSFSRQNAAMKEYFHSHKEKFLAVQ